MSHILRKLSKYIAILNKIKYKLNEKSLILVYYEIFKCHLDYYSHIWGNNFESNIKPISKLHNRVIRLIFKDVHSCILYKKNIMKFTDIVKLKTLIVMFKTRTHILTNNIHLCIYGRKHTFIRNKIRTYRKSF